MNHFFKFLEVSLLWLGIALFVFFYPMLISFYVFFPLLIGLMSYLLIEGIEKEKLSYILVAVVYLLNLEVNLSLPLLLAFISALLFYLLFYPALSQFKRCYMCKSLLSVLILDLMYFAWLVLYGFIFETQSITLDSILMYSLLVDMLVVTLL